MNPDEEEPKQEGEPTPEETRAEDASPAEHIVETPAIEAEAEGAPEQEPFVEAPQRTEVEAAPEFIEPEPVFEAPEPEPPSDNAEEGPILAALGHDPCSLVDLVERTAMSADQLLPELLTLELCGLIGTLPGNRYQRLN